MSDTDRIYQVLRRGSVTTEWLLKESYSANPSQRATDIEKKYGVQIDREMYMKGKRRYARLTLRPKTSTEPIAIGASRTQEPDHGTRRGGGQRSDKPSRSVPSMFDADDCLDWGSAA